MINAVACESCGNWIHGRCAKIRRVTNRLAIDFKCTKYKGYHKNAVNHKEKLHEYVDIVKDFSYQGDGIYSGGGCEAAVTSRTRLRWVKFRDCPDLRKQISSENQEKCTQKLCEISNALWKRDTVPRSERDRDLART